MKKSTLLSFLTAATVVTTTAGTFAVWDSLEARTEGSINFRKPVTLEVDGTYTLTEGQASLGTLPSATSTVTFNIKNNDSKLAKSLDIVPTVSGGQATLSDFDITIEDSTGGISKQTSDSNITFTDSTLDSTVYTVTVTPKQDSVSKVAGQDITISLTGTLK